MTCKMNVVDSDVVVAMKRRRRRFDSSDAENRHQSRNKRTRMDNCLMDNLTAEDSWTNDGWADVTTESRNNNSGNSNSNDCSNEKLQIETEFKILQSIIPGVAKEEYVTELEIIDACVDYIEQLQHQLYLRYNPSQQQQQQQQPPPPPPPPQQQQHLRHLVRGTDGLDSLGQHVTVQYRRQLVNLRQNFRLR